MSDVFAPIPDQFSRTQLVLGSDALVRLSRAHVIVFGVGGVGGSAIEALARTGIGFLDIVDNDKVEPSNINRQIIATWRSVGEAKVAVMQERISTINPACVVTVHTGFYSPETASQFDLSRYDYVIDAIDTITAKIALIEHAQTAHTPIISAMGAGDRTDPCAIRIADIYETSVCPLARVMRRELRRKGIRHLKVAYSVQAPVSRTAGRPAAPTAERPAAIGSCAFVPPAMGLALAAEVVKDLIAHI